MMIRRILGANRDLGAPPDWDAGKLGPCGTLPVRARHLGQGHVTLESAWEPTPEELALLNAGGSVILTIHSGIHPPVSLHVEKLIGELGEVTAKTA